MIGNSKIEVSKNKFSPNCKNMLLNGVIYSVFLHMAISKPCIT